MRLSLIAWGLKQLFPLSYSGVYQIGEQRVSMRWRMWLGWVFGLETGEAK